MKRIIKGRGKFIFAFTYYWGKSLAFSPLLLRVFFMNIFFTLLVIIPNPYHRRIKKSINLFFPNLDSSASLLLIHKTLYNSLHVLADILAIWFRGSEWAGRQIKQIHNNYIIEEAAQRENGIIFISPHLGNWEILVPYLTKKYKCYNIYKDSPNYYYNDLMQRYRGSRGVEGISVDKPLQFKTILKALKQGKGNALMLMPDQRPQRNATAVMANFFGVQIPNNLILYKFLQHLDCEVIFVYAIRRDWGKYEIFVEKPTNEIYDEDIIISTEAMNRSIEKAISRAPAQYNWLQDKLKHFRNN